MHDVWGWAMTEQILSYLITGIGLIGFWLAGKKVWWCWWVNVANQVLWTIFAVVTGYYAFLIGTAFYFVVFTKNAIQWTRDHYKDEEPQRLLPEVTFTVDDEKMRNEVRKANTRVQALSDALDRGDVYVKTKDDFDQVKTEPILVGQDGHICHGSPIPNNVHAYRCPSGEHLMGWRHNQGPHKACDICR